MIAGAGATARTPSSRALFWVLCAVVPAVAGIALIGAIGQEWYHVFVYSWYFIPGINIPQEPVIMYAGTLYPPLLVVMVFSFSTITASLIDYFLVRRIFQWRKLAVLKENGMYRAALRSFYWRPWETIVVFAFSPLPFFPVRILALSSNYPAWKYVSANVVGRVPRYYLLAMGGTWLSIPHLYLIPVGLGLALIPICIMLCTRRSPTLAPSGAA